MNNFFLTCIFFFDLIVLIAKNLKLILFNIFKITGRPEINQPFLFESKSLLTMYISPKI